MIILAIETSCDETSASIIEAELKFKREKIKILSNIISSQVDLHKRYGGVVPEVASRAHMKNIVPLTYTALKQIETKTGQSSPAGILNKIEAIAVTIGPGLIGSLLVGVNFAKTLAYILNKPIVPINHLEGHIYINFVNTDQLKTSRPKFPVLCLIISGGHTSLILIKDYFKHQVLGQTLDDAAGEAFDKIGKLLNLPYPGGPSIEREARDGNKIAFTFPRPMIDSPDFNFSFSGLKTAVLYEVKNQKSTIKKKTIADIAASAQQAIIDVLIKKTIRAIEKYKVNTIMIGGGVAANKELGKQFKTQSSKLKVSFIAPPTKLCTDNAAMIGVAAYFKIKKFGLDKYKDWSKINVDANLKLK